MRSLNEKSIYRIIDANFNRSKEGLRVCEDICRFVLNDQNATAQWKILRHRLTKVIEGLKITEMIEARRVHEDVGRQSMRLEFKRKNMTDIFYANCQRVKESLRVLEELLKLMRKKLAEELKHMRYQVYALEQKIIRKL